MQARVCIAHLAIKEVTPWIGWGLRTQNTEISKASHCDYKTQQKSIGEDLEGVEIGES
jgi:hypothetical protein